MRTTTRWTPATKSIAPPMPFISLPGTIQFARSPNSETCIAPRMARSICPPRIMAKDSALEKKLAPGMAVTVCLPALTRSASTWPILGGKSPMPSSPFSDCNVTEIPGGIKRQPWSASNSQVHVGAVVEFLSRTLGHLLESPRHQFAPRTILRSMRFSEQCSAPRV